MSVTLKYLFLIFQFSLFVFIGCNQPSTTATTATPSKTPTEVVSAQPNTTSDDATKQMLGNLSDNKTKTTTQQGITKGNNANDDNESLTDSKDVANDLQTTPNSNGSTPTYKKKHRPHHKRSYDPNLTGTTEASGATSQNTVQTDNEQTSNASSLVKKIPAKVYTVLAYILKNHLAPPNYVGGRVFTNVEKVLPINDAKGKRINYQEWDVNPHVNGVNRGVERLCTGDDNRDWYTNDHYKTFTQVIPK